MIRSFIVPLLKITFDFFVDLFLRVLSLTRFLRPHTTQSLIAVAPFNRSYQRLSFIELQRMNKFSNIQIAISLFSTLICKRLRHMNSLISRPTLERQRRNFKNDECFFFRLLSFKQDTLLRVLKAERREQLMCKSMC